MSYRFQVFVPTDSVRLTACTDLSEALAAAEEHADLRRVEVNVLDIQDGALMSVRPTGIGVGF